MKNYKKWIALMVLIVVGYAGAAETFTDTYFFGREGVLWDYQSGQWKDNTSVSWAHTLTGFDDNCSITAATLTINACGVDNVWWDFDGDGGYEQMDYVTIEFMGQDLGLLTGNSTTFDLMPYEGLIGSVTNVSSEITFQNDLLRLKGFCGDYVIDIDWHDAIRLNTSTLFVMCDSIPVRPSTVPAPSAVLLGSIGIVFVGWLRKRSAV